MRQIEVQLITELIKSESEANRIFMEDVKRTFAAGFAVTDGKIDELKKTLKEQSDRLEKVEDTMDKQSKIIGILKIVGKRWYFVVGGLVFIILIMIPVVDLIGVKELIKLLIK